MHNTRKSNLVWKVGIQDFSQTSFGDLLNLQGYDELGGE